MTEEEQKLALLQHVCQRSLHAIGQLGDAEAAVVIGKLDPEHLTFHVMGEGYDEVINMMLECLCTFGRLSTSTEEEAFDKLTTQLMTKFNDLKDFDIETARGEGEKFDEATH